MITIHDLQQIEATLRAAPVGDPEVGDAPAPDHWLIPALAQAVHSSRSAVMLTDADLDEPGPRILYVNPACEHLTGYGRDELVGRNPRLLQGESTDHEVLRQLRKHLDSGGGSEGKVVNYRKDGSPFVMSWRISPVRDGGARTVAYVAIQDDATEQWLHELNRLQRMEALARSLQPSALPEPADVELARVSATADASHLGGDWSDVLVDRHGRVHLVAGDVTGHGIIAGLYVGRFRWSLCALLREGIDAPRAIETVRAMNTDCGAYASIGVATISADRSTVDVVTAGHPDVIVVADGRARRLRTDDALVGVALDEGCPAVARAPLGPGAIVCLYTDGLVERRGEPLDVGIEALAARLAGAPDDGPLQAYAEGILALSSPEPAGDAADDVIVLMARV